MGRIFHPIYFNVLDGPSIRLVSLPRLSLSLCLLTVVLTMGCVTSIIHLGLGGILKRAYLSEAQVLSIYVRRGRAGGGKLAHRVNAGR